MYHNMNLVEILEDVTRRFQRPGEQAKMQLGHLLLHLENILKWQGLEAPAIRPGVQAQNSRDPRNFPQKREKRLTRKLSLSDLNDLNERNAFIAKRPLPEHEVTSNYKRNSPRSNNENLNLLISRKYLPENDEIDDQYTRDLKAFYKHAENEFYGYLGKTLVYLEQTTIPIVNKCGKVEDSHALTQLGGSTISRALNNRLYEYIKRRPIKANHICFYKTFYRYTILFGGGIKHFAQIFWVRALFPSKVGHCHGLSCLYLRCQKNNMDFNLNDLKNAKYILKKYKQDTSWLNIERIITRRLYGYPGIHSLNLLNPRDIDSILDCLESHKRILLISLPKLQHAILRCGCKGHSVAISTDNGSYRFFNPNDGEFVFLDRNSMKYFLLCYATLPATDSTNYNFFILNENERPVCRLSSCTSKYSTLSPIPKLQNHRLGKQYVNDVINGLKREINGGIKGKYSLYINSFRRVLLLAYALGQTEEIDKVKYILDKIVEYERQYKTEPFLSLVLQRTRHDIRENL